MARASVSRCPSPAPNVPQGAHVWRVVAFDEAAARYECRGCGAVREQHRRKRTLRERKQFVIRRGRTA
jgi:hypothetical protein